MIDENFAHAIGRCIQKYTHAMDANNHSERYQADYRSKKIGSLSSYIGYLCKDILFDYRSAIENDINPLLGKMLGAYNDIVSCYQITVKKAIEQVAKTISKYENTVMNNSDYQHSTGRVLNIKIYKKQLKAWSGESKNFPKHKSITDSVLASDWSKHFSPFEFYLSELPKMNEEMVTQIREAEDQRKEKVRFRIMILGFVIGAMGFIFGIFAFLYKLNSN